MLKLELNTVYVSNQQNVYRSNTVLMRDRIVCLHAVILKMHLVLPLLDYSIFN